MKAGRELDAKVIFEVLGWELIDRVDTNTRFPFVAREGKDKLVLWMEDDAIGRYFSPSTNIADAWLVVNKLIMDGWEPHIEYEVNRTGVWEVCFGHMAYDAHYHISKDVCEAICLAALKACGVEV
jgi:hypothetical protein